MSSYLTISLALVAALLIGAQLSRANEGQEVMSEEELRRTLSLLNGQYFKLRRTTLEGAEAQAKASNQKAGFIEEYVRMINLAYVIPTDQMIRAVESRLAEIDAHRDEPEKLAELISGNKAYVDGSLADTLKESAKWVTKVQEMTQQMRQEANPNKGCLGKIGKLICKPFRSHPK